MAGFDLHAHSTVSDGTLPPAEVVARAAEAGLEGMALTDHDHVGGVAEAQATGRRLGIEVIAGVELSAEDAQAGELHLLGYFVDPNDAALLARLAELRDMRARRGAAMVERLRAAGVPITLAEVEREVAPGAALGRPHVARVLVAKGHATSIQDVFDRWLAEGRPGYVPKERLSPQDAIALVHAAGGVAVLAHAVTVDEPEREGLVRRLAAMGLDGLEVAHSKHGEQERATLAAWAQAWGLVATGGSDFHGANKPGVALGSVRVGREVVDALRTRARRHGRS
ncbi:MAG: 3,5-nucleoside bisphosphate phosphatase [Thermoplasmata archaeon]|jgi:predicted metal-dependent phosphoesterase TrpH|nr:3,5-nucleoside bisphosphate phosphatase [Thermoplasmata archaeon]